MKPIVAFFLILLATVVMMPTTIWAQGCSMCTATASNLDGKAAQGLNFGILYLGLIPLILIFTLFYKWYKSYKQSREAE